MHTYGLPAKGYKRIIWRFLEDLATLGRMTCNYKFYVIILAKLRFRKIFALLYCIDSSSYDSVVEISFPKDYVWIYDDMFKDFWPQFDNDDVAEIFLVFESENFMKIWTNYFFPFISSYHKNFIRCIMYLSGVFLQNAVAAN